MRIQDLMKEARGDARDDVDLLEVPDDLSGLDAEEQLPPDPKPREQKRRVNTPKPSAPVKVSAAMQRKIRDQLLLMIGLPSAGLALRDPYCGGVLTAQSEAICDALVPIICRNPSMLRWFGSGGGWLDYLALAAALRPVVQTGYQHHVAHTIGAEHEADHDHDQQEAPSYAVAGF